MNRNQLAKYLTTYVELCVSEIINFGFRLLFHNMHLKNYWPITVINLRKQELFKVRGYILDLKLSNFNHLSVA